MKTDWHQDTVALENGVELFYTRTGQGDKPAIVLAHGITDSGLCWHQLAGDLDAKYDLIMYDAQGHGKSSRIDPQKPVDLVEDLLGLIEALNLEKLCVMGHSMGAATAAEFAAAHPEKLTALILEDPPWSNVESTAEQLSATMQAWKKQNLAAKKKTLKELVGLKKKESPTWQEAILKEWAQAKLDVDPAIFDQPNLISREWRQQAAAIQVPTLIITGDPELGAIVSTKLGLEAVKLLKHGEFGHISSAGHCVRYEQYGPYLAMVNLYLKHNLTA